MLLLANQCRHHCQHRDVHAVSPSPDLSEVQDGCACTCQHPVGRYLDASTEPSSFESHPTCTCVDRVVVDRTVLQSVFVTGSHRIVEDRLCDFLVLLSRLERVSFNIVSLPVWFRKLEFSTAAATAIVGVCSSIVVFLPNDKGMLLSFSVGFSVLWVEIPVDK